MMYFVENWYLFYCSIKVAWPSKVDTFFSDVGDFIEKLLADTYLNPYSKNNGKFGSLLLYFTCFIASLKNIPTLNDRNYNFLKQYFSQKHQRSNHSTSKL